MNDKVACVALFQYTFFFFRLKEMLKSFLFEYHQKKMQIFSSFARIEDWFCQKFTDNSLNAPEFAKLRVTVCSYSVDKNISATSQLRRSIHMAPR